MNIGKRPFWLELFLMILVPVVGMALGVGITITFSLNQTDYSNLIVNLFLFAAGILLVRIFKLSREDLGLKLIEGQLKWHAILSLTVFTLYVLFYIFVIRISALKAFSASTLWGLLTYLIVVVAEELYFRGALYRFFEKRFSGRTAFIVTSLLFGLFHARQGLSAILSRSTTGFLWGSIRYSTRMIFLIIFPIHFMYNATWLLFEGNWNNPPVWAIYTLPFIEFVLGLVIVFLQNNKQPQTKDN
jgi:membrane protease YdiL (CAAX protease family)